MRDLEERVTDMRAELEKERAHQARTRKLVYACIRPALRVQRCYAWLAWRHVARGLVDCSEPDCGATKACIKAYGGRPIAGAAGRMRWAQSLVKPYALEM